VVATTSIVADAVQRIGGPHVHLTTLMPPGTDPHTHLPSPADAEALASARLVLFNGLHLEGKMTDLLEQPQSGRRAAAVASAIPVSQLRPADGRDAAHDPHVWFDVKLWAECMKVVRDELVALDPAHAAEFRANADAYLAELAALDAEVRAAINKLPPDRRILVTSHDAFGYFGRAYGVTVRGLQGVSTASAAGTKDVEGLATFLAENGVPAVFGESSVAEKGLYKVLDTVRSRYGRTVKLVGGADALYSDSLGPPGSPGETYVGMVRHNVGVMVKALAP
jgi:manganese/zinc/iron transport system substrate-binding protein